MRALLILVLATSMWGQVLLPTLDTVSEPDFGIRTGDWGLFQARRPYGFTGIVYQEPRELTQLNPISGQALSLHMGWQLEPTGRGSWWEQNQHHLALPADSLYPTLVVTARQGNQDLKSFNIWLHRGLNENSSIGLQSELRGQLGVYPRPYRQQIHRVELLRSSSRADLRLDLAHHRLQLPLYLYVTDSSSGVLSLDMAREQQRSLVQGMASLRMRSPGRLGFQEAAWLVRSGYWTSTKNKKQEWSTLADLNGTLERPFSLDWQLGLYRQQVDTLTRKTPFARFNSDMLGRGSLSGTLGFGLTGLNNLYLVGYGAWQRSGLGIIVRADPLLHDPGELQDLEIGSLQRIRLRLGPQHLHLATELWSGQIPSQGNAEGVSLLANLRSRRDARFELAIHELLSQPNGFVWDTRRVSWRYIQPLNLLKGKLKTRLTAWGNHHYGTSPGLYQESTLNLIPSGVARSSEWIHRINYAVEIQVRTLRFGFTDVNMLQDVFWQDILGEDWSTTITPVLNQPFDYRMQYFTLCWEFQQ